MHHCSLFSFSGCRAFALMIVAAMLGACGGDAAPDSGASSGPDTSRVDPMTMDRVLRTDDRFSTLVTGVDSTGLDSVLAREGPYTLFAPPNSAFEALPDGTLSVLLSDRLDRLRTVLAHHVVEGEVSIEAIADSTVQTTLAGDTLHIRPTDSTHAVGRAQVLDGDIRTENGLIHVIDAVLRPPRAESD